MSTTASDLERMGSVCACLHLRRAARAVSVHFDAALQPFGVKATQYTLLAAIRNLGPVTPRTLAERLALDPSSLSRNVACLERAGLVRASIGPRDRRLRPLSVTRKGDSLVHRAYAAWHRAQSELESQLHDEDFSSLLRMLRRTTNAALTLTGERA